ncbi:MAG: hypothetical protein LBU85_11420 [Treponema sp.]|jgi:HD superfamily phosphohydrolase|nr:hypothetical protein [Treponema sp.]
MTISLVVSIISLSLCVSGFFFLRWYISQRTDASRLLEEYRDEVSRLITEIHAATDRDSLLVEERIKNTRKLLDDTDKRISVYTRELQRSRNSEAVYKNLGRGIREALGTIPASPQEAASSAKQASSAKSAAHAKTHVHTEINELPFSDEEKGPRIRSEKKQRKQKTANTRSPGKPPEKTGIKMQIAQMALQGLSPTQIASRLKISLAEVDLALQLLNMNNKE